MRKAGNPGIAGQRSRTASSHYPKATGNPIRVASHTGQERHLMFKRLTGRATLVVLVSFSLSAAKKKAPPPQYSNSRQYRASCDQVWPVAIRTLSKSGFVPQSADKAGGLLTLSWRKGSSGGVFADRDVKGLTSASHGALTTFDRFNINTTSAVFTAESQGCSVEITMALTAWKNSLLQKGWVAIESNGLN